MRINADTLNRTLKLEVDEGRAHSIEEAERIASEYVLQLAVGAGVEESPTRQAMLLTVLNAGRRAFFGGVRIRTGANFRFTTPWAAGKTLHEVVEPYGCKLLDEPFDPNLPVAFIGNGQLSGALHLTWESWAGAVVTSPTDRLAEETENPLTGVMTGGLAVSEMFQRVRGYAPAARRNVGVSLWRPDADWRDQDAAGPLLTQVPTRLWLAGLGHLGQAYAWALGFFRYPSGTKPSLMLQDFDFIVEANESTSLLANATDKGQRKTRLVAGALERLGFETAITERAFDEHTRRTNVEPALLLAGFDRPEPRQALEQAGFAYVIDAGLGRGTHGYLDMVVHSFPSGIRAETAFPVGSAPLSDTNQPAYEHLVREMVETGTTTEAEARCGIVEIAGRTVGASFVGAVAASVTLSEALRILADGPRYQVVSLSLRNPQRIVVARNESPGQFTNPGSATLA